MLILGDDEKIAGAASGIETPIEAIRRAQVFQLAHIVARCPQLRAQIVQKQWVQHFQDVGHARVVQAQRAALLLLGDGLNHRAENIGVDLLPVQFARAQEIGARHTAEARS